MREVFPPVDVDEEVDTGPDPWASFGQDNGRAVLTRDHVAEMRRSKAEGWSVRELVARYGVRPHIIGAVLQAVPTAIPRDKSGGRMPPLPCPGTRAATLGRVAGPGCVRGRRVSGSTPRLARFEAAAGETSRKPRGGRPAGTRTLRGPGD